MRVVGWRLRAWEADRTPTIHLPGHNRIVPENPYKCETFFSVNMARGNLAWESCSYTRDFGLKSCVPEPAWFIFHFVQKHHAIQITIFEVFYLYQDEMAFIIRPDYKQMRTWRGMCPCALRDRPPLGGCPLASEAELKLYGRECMIGK